MSIKASDIELVSVNELLTEADITCPYCWELQSIVIDHTDEQTRQVIDCQICCQPILIHMQFTGNSLQLQADREN